MKLKTIMGKAFLITNNPLVASTAETRFKGQINILYNQDLSYLEVMHQVRNKIHQGFILLSHPLSGSIKPNETPYKSVVLDGSNVSKETVIVDFSSLKLIEEAIMTTEKFNRSQAPKPWPAHKLEDFQLIDCDLIIDSIEKSV